MATSGGKPRREEASDNSDDELTPLANDIYGGRCVIQFIMHYVVSLNNMIYTFALQDVLILAIKVWFTDELAIRYEEEESHLRA